MAKDDFDINFDFDQDFDFDPKAFLADEELDKNMNLDQFSDEDLGLQEKAGEEKEEASDSDDDFDLDLDLDALLGMDGEDNIQYAAQSDMEDVPSFAKKDSAARLNVTGYGMAPELPMDSVPSQLEEEPEPPMEEPVYEEDVPAEEESYEEEAQPRRRERKKVELPKINLPKLTTPVFLTKFFDLYFAPVLNKELREEPQDPNNPRRRRRKSKVQIFKEVYLPPIIVCLTLILVLTFAVGSLSNFIKEKELERDTEQSRLEESKSAQEMAEAQAQAVLMNAQQLASGYDYENAIKVLDTFLAGTTDSTAFPEINAKRSELATAQSQLVSHQDPSLIPNLSFHVLINDMAKAKQDPELGGLYNRNFVTTGEFSKILGELYNNNYVLVDFSSFTDNINGTIHSKPIYLPDGKKPIMLTETMVNYFTYMIDSNNDGEADAGGDSFASRLVVDANGDIKAEYVDATGATLTGNYDFVPILEDFIEEHPDFSYQGARAILAVTGEQGIFGYRINSSYQADKGESYRNEQVAGAKQLVQALRDKGYTLACFTYANVAYGKINANQITSDLQQWTQQITPVLGQVDVMVYARESDISDYGGNSFTVMNTSGFRYFVSNATTPSTEVNTTYVRQKRLMVTGNSLAWHQDMFTGIFDPNSVIDMTTRIAVPN